jgi:cytochrome c oxidase accessory protein FixG
VVPSADDVQSSLAADGRRRFVYPADVRGRFVTRRRAIFAALVAVWLALPLVKIGGHPALFLDVATRQFYLFGATFNAQDAWLLVFVVTGIVFALALTTALFGRVFCGYACPQTVFLEGMFRPIERLVEGPREKRIRRDHGPLTFDKVWRKIVKHTLFFVAAAFVAHVMLSFFVSVPATLAMVRGNPADHPEAFAWAAAVTLVLYGDFAWFREQVCLIVCPYGRLQSTLLDDDTLVIGYDEKRGEPRGKVHDTGAGDCIDCKRCVAVCPTGIDIRNGLQLDCIGCTACIDACDEIMDKMGSPRGLIRYTTEHALHHEPTRLLRPRVLIYGALLSVLIIGFVTAIVLRSPVSLDVIRDRNTLYRLTDDGNVDNVYTLRILNKTEREQTFRIEARGASPLTLVPGEREYRVASGTVYSLPLRVRRAAYDPVGPETITLTVRSVEDPEVSSTTDARFLAPAK